MEVGIRSTGQWLLGVHQLRDGTVASRFAKIQAVVSRGGVIAIRARHHHIATAHHRGGERIHAGARCRIWVQAVRDQAE